MATVKAFSCIRPRKDLADQIAALPYDVYNREEARQAVKGKIHTFLRIDRPETQFPENYDMYSEEVYQKAYDLLQDMICDGRYEKDEEEAYYIYQLVMDGRAQNGIVGCASIDDYLTNVIKKHENTREEKELDRIRHVDTCNAQTGPIFLAYRSNPVLSELVQKIVKSSPLYSFVSEDGVEHNVWKVSEEDDKHTIDQCFSDMNQLYIADGHHRAASAVKVGLKRREESKGYTGEEEFNYFLSVLFPEDELMILPYNRVVKDLNGYSLEEFLKSISENFEVVKKESPVTPEHKGHFGMYFGQTWYELTAKQHILSEDPVEGLDVSILQNHLLAPVLGIGDPRTDDRIDFVGGIRGLEELERRVHTDAVVAFSMYPTSIQELFTVADSGCLMPPKSTWFEPKLRSGLFIHSLD